MTRNNAKKGGGASRILKSMSSIGIGKDQVIYTKEVRGGFYVKDFKTKREGLSYKQETCRGDFHRGSPV